MRRWLAGAVLAIATFLASGCAVPPGTDGDLTNQWPVMAAPTGWEPKTGDCTSSPAIPPMLARVLYAVVECHQSHYMETVHVGTFVGAAADFDSPPTDTTSLTAAYKECDAKAEAYLGADWRDGVLWLKLQVPSPAAWDVGARWFRCGIAIVDHALVRVEASSRSLKGELSAKASSLRLGCATYDGEDESDIEPIPCTKPHNTEYVGAARVGGPWPGDRKDSFAIFRECRPVIAKFVGMPDGTAVWERTGMVYTYPSKDEWTNGDQSVRCHLWLGDKVVSKSLNGVGRNGIPR